MDRVATPASSQSPTPPRPTGPLDGIRILDLTSVVLGPLATQVLADFGADVIKVEGPEGDLMRANGVSVNAGMSSIYIALNRNKRSVVLDLKQESGRAAMWRLIESADVLIHNMRVAAVERLGFGYKSAVEANPRLIYCAATGFGQEGPNRGKPAFDDVIQAACGLVSVGSLGRDAPSYIPSLIADKTTGLAVANAVLAALVRRERAGPRGQYIEVPMLETMTAFVLTEHMGGMTFPGNTEVSPRAGYARLLEGGRRPSRTRDGWISMLPYTDKHWTAFFRAAGRPELCEQYRLADSQSRNENITALYRHMAELTPGLTTDEWMACCEEFDIPAAPIYRLDDLPSHPHLAAVGLFEESVHPSEGVIRQIRPVARFNETPTSIRRPAPRLGEHTEEVLREIGLDSRMSANQPPPSEVRSPQ